jgi:hypothetical protein
MISRHHLSLVIPAFGFLAFASPVSAALVAHYSFDSDYSLTGGSYSGSLSETESGGATVGISTTTGEYKFGGGAASFSSTISNAAYLGLTVGNPIEFTVSEAWSISFWVRRSAGSDIRQGMIAGDTSNTTDFLWAADNSAQVQGMRFRNTSNGNANFGGHPDDGNFHHWVVISDGASTISAYRDNVAQTDVSTGGNFTINAIGHAYNATTFSMNGQIDELYIFNEAIDATTVGNLFNTNTIPEPATFALLALGGMAALRRRRMV